MVPICKAVKFIKFTVEMVDENDDLIYDSNSNPLRKEIIVKHFPTDYVVNLEGLWSSRTDNNWARWKVSSGSVSDAGGSQAHFKARVFKESTGEIHVMNSYNTYGNRILEKDGVTPVTNNHIYVILTKSISGGDVVSKPLITSSNHTSSDNVISPAFMVASQLGTINYGWESWQDNIGTHCNTYMEVTREGKKFKNWRIPTLKEMKYANEYADTYNLVMEKLFTATYYYTLEGQKRGSSYWGVSTSSSRGAVRCVRDLTPDDIRYVNGEMTQAEITEYLNN